MMMTGSDSRNLLQAHSAQLKSKFVILSARFSSSMDACKLWLIASSLVHWLLLFKMSHGTPLPPVRCLADGSFNCTVSGTYGTWPDRSPCRAARALFPASEEELVTAVAFGSRNKMKMKVVSKSSHSMTKLVCPGGDEGLIISTQKLNRIVQVDPSTKTVVVDSGVQLQDLVDSVARFGLSLPHSPYWNGLSIGGVISTGAHGSSLFGKGSAVHEYVIAMRLIVPSPSAEEGYARVINVTSEAMLNAARVSLGVLGVVSQATLALEPLFKRSVRIQQKADASLEDEIVEHGRMAEFGDVAWYPSQKTALFRIDNRVPVDTPGEGVNEFLGFRPEATALLRMLRMSEELYEATNNPAGKCTMSTLQVDTLVMAGMGFKNQLQKFTGYPVIGFQNKIQTTGTCENVLDQHHFCPWDPQAHGLFFHQTTVSISLDRIRDFIVDVKKLRDMNPSAFCGAELYYGVLLRYVRGSRAFLGKSEDSVDVDITYYRSRDAHTPRLNQDVYEEIEQLAVFKYRGQSHWGKNRNVAFIGAAEKYPGLTTFLQVRQSLDPEGLFSSEWSDSMLGLSSSGVANSQAKHCALEGLCLCSSDEHCAPEKKYYCRPGRVFANARVCRKGS
ncbi:L-gulonolactone oxidase 3 [Selaginella moellendorffii]|nr:L-gulonolactone oxidase 3 [Selaginella moellendorffii]|eukprot:XP_002982127.2 L-gulonolactone oxidase 3 [Selaginella moellendorffii]